MEQPVPGFSGICVGDTLEQTENTMKHRVFHMIFSVFTIIAIVCGCTGRAKSPGISFLSERYEFGTVDEGESVNHVFEFTNNGTETLVLVDVHPTCGCTVAGDYDREVKPGMNGKIPIIFKTSGYDGPVAKTIIVKTNVPNHPDIMLAIEGTVKVTVNVRPKEFSFGNIERDRTTPLEAKIAISNRSPDPIKITDVIKVTDAIEVPNVTYSTENVVTKVETIKAGFEYTLVITVRPPFKHGQVIGTILVKTDSTKLPEIHTQFSYSTEHLVKVFPNPLFVSKDMVTKGIVQPINIECESCHDMRIVDIAVNIDQVGVSLEETEKGRKYRLALNIPKNFTFDPSNTLTIKFRARNVPDEPVFGIPVLLMTN
jgi:hypothetical protein